VTRSATAFCERIGTYVVRIGSRFVIGALLALLIAAAPAMAATPRTSFNDVEDEVMCVSCGVPLNIAESPQADRERVEVRRLIARGLTKDEVKDELVATYGRNVLAMPDDGGFGLAAYLVPIGIGAAIVALLAFLLPKWRRRQRAPGTAFGRAAPAPALSDADARRLDEDLARYDS
jgi:cytochrome c-type biogenesis protein CcmH/NrfF